MDNDDESSLSPTPDDFVISTYKGNPLANINQTKMHDNSKISFLNKCSLCRKIHENTLFTCSACVNAGKICSSKHNLRSVQQRETLLSMLTKDDYEEFRKKFDENSTDLQYAELMFLLKKFKSQQAILQLEFDKKSQSSIKIRLMAEEIQFRKNRHRLIRQSIEKFREQMEQKKQLNKKIQHRIDEIRPRVHAVEKKTKTTKKYVKLSNNKCQEMIDECTQAEDNLQRIRQTRLRELLIHVFPIEHVLKPEDNEAKTMKALKRAVDSKIDDEQIETEDSPEVVDDRYRIVNSSLPSNGNYHPENLVSIYNSGTSRDSDSPQLSPSCDSYKTLSALSHACQLINIIAIYLNIKLPFYLHPWNFNQDKLLVDDLRADIAKLNANILTTCLSQGILIEFANVSQGISIDCTNVSQGIPIEFINVSQGIPSEFKNVSQVIPIEFTNASHTLENLLKLLTFKQYPTRPKAVIYPECYIDMLNKEVSDVNRALMTSYWFDDDDNNQYQMQRTEIFDNEHEYEIIPPNEFIPDGSLITREHVDSSMTISGQQQASSTSSDHQQPSLTTSSIFSSKYWLGYFSKQS